MSNPKTVAFWFLFLPFVGLLIHKHQDLAKPKLDLGVAYYPQQSAQSYQQASYSWSAPKLPSRYLIAYAHGEGAMANAYADHQQLARSFNYKALDAQTFTWNYRTDCIDRWGLELEQTWACVYSEIIANDWSDLNPLLSRVGYGLRQEKLSTTDAARWLLAFVQAIPYKIPDDSPFGVLPPSLVASERWGDCDSKSLLLIYLLRGVGIDAQLLTSVAHQHAMVAIGVPASSAHSFDYYGRRYAWAETTSNAPLGWVDPGMLLPNDWQLVPIVMQDTSG